MNISQNCSKHIPDFFLVEITDNHSGEGYCIGSLELRHVEDQIKLVAALNVSYCQDCKPFEGVAMHLYGFLKKYLDLL